MPRLGGTARRWRARLLVVTMLAAAGYGGYELLDLRSTAAAQLDLGTLTLTAEPVPVQSDRLGLVRSVAVHANDRVRKGQPLGTIASTTTTGAGKAVTTTITLRSPITGIVSAEPVAVGGALQVGESFVELYDPQDLTLTGAVASDKLRNISPGMTAYLQGADLSRPVTATVGQVVPRLENDTSDVRPGYLQIELVPTDPGQVADLVPGLRFTGAVDTRTARPGEDPSVYVG